MNISYKFIMTSLCKLNNFFLFFMVENYLKNYFYNKYLLILFDIVIYF